MQNTCAKCTQQFEITAEDIKFYEKIAVPPPAKCPACRMQLRFTARNTRKLYYRKCDFSGEKIISQYHPDLRFPVYKPEIWWGDAWDGTKYGRDFDFSRPFFEQFLELKNQVPHQSVFVIPGSAENSDYTNCTGQVKNCYLIFESDYDEDCMYSNLLKNSRNMCDCSICYDGELCYECVNCVGCYNLRYSKDCMKCSDSFFLENCQDCKDCIGCMNQKHKQYMILNKQYSKEEYEKAKAKMELGKFGKIQEYYKTAQAFFLKLPHKNLFLENVEKSSGDHLLNCKNAYECFDCKDLEDCRYCQKLSLGVKDSMDYNSWGDKAELIYESSACGDNIYNLKFCATCSTNVSNCEYCIECAQSKNLFGCAGLVRKEYCIFNKQYGKEEYESLKKKIIEHMKKTGEYGQFFPSSVLPFAYNESLAFGEIPLTKEEAIKQGFKWREEEELNQYLGPKPVVPETIEETPEEITNNILQCKSCGKNYKIIKSEFTFYKKNDIPVPNFCADCRAKERLSKRNPYRLFARPCAKCATPIQTSYSPARPEIVYCEPCYLKEVY